MPARDMTRWVQNEDGTWRPKAHAKQPAFENQEELPEVNVEPIDGNGDYSEMTLVELREALVARDLPKTGNKPELIERLEESDALA